MLFALGFVFLFTVGGLSNHLALPLKTTICWKLLTIGILSFYTVTIFYFVQSAGNWRTYLINVKKISITIQPGTSETKRSPHNPIHLMLLWEDIVHVIKLLILFFYFIALHVQSLKLVLLSYAYRLEARHNAFSSKCNICTLYPGPNNPLNKEDKNKLNINPVKVYNNFKEDRAKIMRESDNKSGVYYLINNVNGHAYVGSSINLASRMRNYLNTSFLKSKQNINIPIIKALLKYNQSSFSLLILKYVEIEQLALIETSYIIEFAPYYNVLKQGYSSIGYKHTEETKLLLSELAKNRVHSAETKALIARALTGENNPFYNKNHSMETKVRIAESKSAYPVYVYDSFKKLIAIYPSVLTLAKKIHSNHPTIVTYINNQTLFRGEWYFSNIPYNISDTPTIRHWNTIEGECLAKKIADTIKVKKGIFVYDKNKKFLSKHTGVTEASKIYKLSHLTIKKIASVNGLHDSGYYFCYERLEYSF